MSNLTSKELSAIEDLLTQEQILIKKYNVHGQSSNDPTIKSQCEQIAAKHQNHYNTLLSQLN